MKYRNTRTEVDGIVFDSRAEANRWQYLRLMEKGGHISDLKRQPVFHLAASVVFKGSKRRKPAMVYRADFSYVRDGLPVVEDVKGVETPVFRIKRHLMKALHGIDIEVVK